MKTSDLLQISLNNLKRRKGRTILTVLGVIIGTCSIVMMVSIGVALNKSNEDMIKSMGDLTRIDIYNWKSEKEQTPITDAVIKQFQEMDNVIIATPIYQSDYLQNIIVTGGSNGKYEWSGYVGSEIIGMYREAIEYYGYQIEDGRFISQSDKEFTALAGKYTAYNFMNPKRQWPNNMVSYEPDENGVVKDPFVNLFKDKFTLKVNSPEEDGKAIEKSLTIVGTVKEDISKGYETHSGLIMCLEDLIQLEEEYIKQNKIRVPSGASREKKYTRAVVKVEDIKYVEETIDALEEMGYTTSSPTSWLESMKQGTQTIQLILAGLGSISLLVAAIGIANTMTMAIYERRREIGIMKVLGCEVKNIRAMFLIESAGIGFIGGIVGIVISYGLSALLNYIGGSMAGMSVSYGEPTKTYISIIPIWLALTGLGFSTLVGMLSGFFPANKAVKISALTAIKND